MKKSELHKVDHSVLRYTNCWEDADLLLEALKPEPGAKILSIGSAGDNSFSLLTTAPGKLVCVDINATQLALIRLKKAAFQALEYSEFLVFLGFTEGGPLRYWEKVQGELQPGDREFWAGRLDLIQKRIIYQGKFERYLLIFQRKLLPLMHGQRNVEKLFEIKPPEEQQDFYAKSWNNWRWRLFTRLFFSRSMLGRGRDPAFLKQVRGNVGERIKQKINAHLSSVDSQYNHFLQFMLRGGFNGRLPQYARPENFVAIKANVHKLETFHGALDEYGECGFSHANLSNIFEYLDEESFAANANIIAGMIRPNARIAYWNLLVERDLAKSFPGQFSSCAFQDSRSDYGFFYRDFKLNLRE